ncbi:MAG: lipoyl(octanoyl) transferase LipB [Rickettsiales bacterium]
MSPDKLKWKISQHPVAYPDSISFMEERVEDIIAGNASEMVWLLEHPPLYTAGTSANMRDLLSHDFPLYETGRGGQITYHGPGQRIAYVMLDLKKRGQRDVRNFVKNLEEWLISSLAEFGIVGQIREGRVGVWVNTPSVEAKIAALGIRIRKWVTFHGIALNVNPELEHYKGIVPCGVKGFGVTSMSNLGVSASMKEVDEVLKKKFAEVF